MSEIPHVYTFESELYAEVCFGESRKLIHKIELENNLVTMFCDDSVYWLGRYREDFLEDITNAVVYFFCELLREMATVQISDERKAEQISRAISTLVYHKHPSVLSYHQCRQALIGGSEFDERIIVNQIIKLVDGEELRTVAERVFANTGSLPFCARLPENFETFIAFLEREKGHP